MILLEKLVKKMAENVDISSFMMIFKMGLNFVLENNIIEKIQKDSLSNYL